MKWTHALTAALFTLLYSNLMMAARTVVRIDGSSTVFPISQAAAEDYQNHLRATGKGNTQVTVASSGTGGGFKKWCIGETDINDASREIKDSEKALAAKNGISFIELPIASDGISVVVSKKNTFVKQLTLAQLNALWKPGSQIKTWNQINPAWPNKEIKLYGPGTDSGTFDYFTKRINGEEGASRSDYTPSEDDNFLVKGVANSEFALGYFGYAYFVENQDKIRAIPLIKEGGTVAIAPNDETIKENTYPISRELYIYVNSRSAQRPAVADFVKYYLDNAAGLAKTARYTALTDTKHAQVRQQFGEFVKTATAKGTTSNPKVKKTKLSE